MKLIFKIILKILEIVGIIFKNIVIFIIHPFFWNLCYCKGAYNYYENSLTGFRSFTRDNLLKNREALTPIEVTWLCNNDTYKMIYRNLSGYPVYGLNKEKKHDL